MSELINIREYPVKDVLGLLLKDKTTKKNIIWATDAYASNGPSFSDKSQITVESLLGLDSVALQPRIEKEASEQRERTRKKAEVFTPVWLCNRMNNDCDEQWFGRRDVFNVEQDDHKWEVIDAKIAFPEGKTWKSYVDSRRLEITCGEAPYLVSRYDAATGDLILPPLRRIGILDRKLRIVNENTNSEEDWLKWAVRAFQASYGYEYQGDSLLSGRLWSLWDKQADIKLLRTVANIISWNIWQMDGLKGTVPLGKPYEEFHQISLFENPAEESNKDERKQMPCRVYDWRRDSSVLYNSIGERR